MCVGVVHALLFGKIVISCAVGVALPLVLVGPFCDATGVYSLLAGSIGVVGLLAALYGICVLRNLRVAVGVRAESWIGITVVHFVLFLIICWVMLLDVSQSKQLRCHCTFRDRCMCAILRWCPLVLHELLRGHESTSKIGRYG
jgi:hypothetical protein